MIQLSPSHHISDLRGVPGPHVPKPAILLLNSLSFSLLTCYHKLSHTHMMHRFLVSSRFEKKYKGILEQAILLISLCYILVRILKNLLSL